MFEDGGRGQSWPHLLHTANSSQSEVWLDGMLSRADRSRFLLELQAVGGAYPPSKVETYETIDDEFTPSIFKVINDSDRFIHVADLLIQTADKIRPNCFHK